MKIHSQAAFVGNLGDRQHGTKRQRQRLPPFSSRTMGAQTDLFLSPAGDYSISTTPTTVPIANFDTSSDFEPIVFEPILNVPALVTFVSIMAVFSALILRTNQVEDAVQERKRRQEEVRDLKAREVGEGTVAPEQIEQTLRLYEDAVRKEERLRNILPGVRIVPPSSSDRREEEAQAIAKQYLGEDFNIGVPKRYNEKIEDTEGGGGLPGAAIGVLAVVALSQVGLLAFFNFGADPMSGNGALM
ncbi:unnamed protein product [Pseudo-nitzschia multistriata]|uniref:Uncharacterized protein n=1 Tax=Pseudo-nitzschia multistriata TaxID=183589 RepID=A0A448Z5E0_9STRA|nr:unnamed protein product [Pseudo-nitzschia multistriata]